MNRTLRIDWDRVARVTKFGTDEELRLLFKQLDATGPLVRRDPTGEGRRKKRGGGRVRVGVSRKAA
jgi:hypothetical protein